MAQKDTFEDARKPDPIQLEIRNVGGISRAELSVSAGVTLISGRNASNKSSLLRSISGVLGAPAPRIKSDAETGSVRMAVGGAEYYLNLGRREGETVVTDSKRYASTGERCELFVALTETNPIRQAVLVGDDLYDLLMQPIDTDEIEAEIRRLAAEHQSLEDRLEEIEAVENGLPGLRARRNRLQKQLRDIEATLREKRETIETIEATRKAESDLETATLRAKRDERREVQNRIRTHENAVESLEAELEDVTGRLEEFGTDDSAPDVERIEDELDRLHRQKQQLTSTINALGPIVEMNAQMLEEDEEVPEAMTAGEIVEELDPSSRTITCWTCGSTVERAEIAEQVEAVRGIIDEKRVRRDDVTERIRTFTERKRELEQKREELDALRTRREEMTAELDERRETLAELETERRALETELEELQRQLEGPTEADARLAELYDEISDLEYERGQLDTDLGSIRSELEDAEAELSKRDGIEARRASVAEALREQRRRIEDLERTLVRTFNEEIQHVLDSLEYESIERIWIERRSTDEGTPSGTEFELHVVRKTDDGSVYEDTLDTLSKSEREVVGLVVALAGYLAHDVGSEIPFLVVDAVEMFDADRIRGLLEHFGQYTEFVICAVLPEEGDELADVYETIPTDSFAGPG